MSKRPGSVIRWLLDGDPAIRWQVQRDLLQAGDREVDRERAKVTREGWGARLLGQQAPDGSWGEGLYNPKWTSTTYTLLLLRDFGLRQENPQARRACSLLLDEGLREDGGINLERREQSETCVTGMVLSLLSYFRYDDDRVDVIADHLLDQQMSDGGWNCRRPLGATHGSMNTTINVLEGLHLFDSYRGGDARALRAAQRRGREFLLVHRLFRSHRTGRVIKSEFTRFVFPPRWHYDVLRALDYFQGVDASRDPRFLDAIDLVGNRQHEDGRWSLDYAYSGKKYFDLEQLGKPSRWNTLRALRVLKWWKREDPD